LSAKFFESAPEGCLPGGFYQTLILKTMKRIMRVLTVTSLLLVSVSLCNGYSQPFTKNQSGGNNARGAPIGGGTAPVGSGLALLVALSVGYGILKFDKSTNGHNI
jgi:hypothetical protein